MNFVMSTLTINDQMTAFGPSTRHAGANATKYTYVDFAKQGRVLNVVSMAIDPRFQELLWASDAAFHFSTATDANTGLVTNSILAVGRQGEQKFAENLDLPVHQLVQDNAKSEILKGSYLQWFGVLLILIGIPLILVFVGILLIGLGAWAIVTGRRTKRIKGFIRDYHDYQRQIIATIPDVRLVQSQAT